MFKKKEKNDADEQVKNIIEKNKILSKEDKIYLNIINQYFNEVNI